LYRWRLIDGGAGIRAERTFQSSTFHYKTAPACKASAEHASFRLGDAAVLRPFSPRRRSEAQATHIAMADTALVPLYWQAVHWAARNGINYTPRRDEITAARCARPF
jgi:hypothetical protein